MKSVREDTAQDRGDTRYLLFEILDFLDQVLYRLHCGRCINLSRGTTGSQIIQGVLSGAEFLLNVLLGYPEYLPIVLVRDLG
jgi:hypothetical protein